MAAGRGLGPLQNGLVDGNGDAERPPSATRFGVGTAALRHCRGDCAICGWRFGTMGEFAPCAARVFRPVRGATRGAAFGNRDLDSTPSVGKSARRGIFRQGKVWIRSHTVCMARSRTAAMAEKARREPQTYGRGEVPTRKKSSKTFIVFIYDTGGGTDTPAHR